MHYAFSLLGQGIKLLLLFTVELKNELWRNLKLNLPLPNQFSSTITV